MFHRFLTAAAPVPPASDGGPAREGTKQRDALFDNAKYLAIVLVAMGHAWEPLRDGSRTVTAFHLSVYAFHASPFIVVSDYFARNFEPSPVQLKRLVTGLAVPYVVFETAYTPFTRWTDQVPDRPISRLDSSGTPGSATAPTGDAGRTW